jgi:hypothetical protein
MTPYRACPVCNASLVPFEDDTCVGCSLTNPERVVDRVMVTLETADEPLFIHDIQRSIEREYGYANWRSVAVIVSQDPRPCWAGRGLYGLTRHGLIPGQSRGLGAPIVAVLAAFDRPLALESVSFVLQWMGYRFSRSSLTQHLRHHLVSPNGLRLYTVERAEFLDWRYRWLAPDRDQAEAILDYLQPVIQKGLDEGLRRLKEGKPSEQ